MLESLYIVPPWSSNNEKYAKTDYSVNILSGLDNGNYTIEVYYKATSNLGDRYYNNNGNNYKATFTVEDKTVLNGKVTVTPLLPTGPVAPFGPTLPKLPFGPVAP